VLASDCGARTLYASHEALRALLNNMKISVSSPEDLLGQMIVTNSEYLISE
jgi:hypothetical protein